MTIHRLLDTEFGDDWQAKLISMLASGSAVDLVDGAMNETPLHVATRRYRPEAISVLVDHGASLDAVNACGKTAWAHAVRRGFAEPARILEEAGADTSLTHADRLAVALVSGDLQEARSLLDGNAGIACTGNQEEDRLLADLAGREATEPVRMLIEAGADLFATAVDDGTPLHQACWFGQPANARQLIDAGAPLDIFDSVHQSSPIGWVTHGSRYSGGAHERGAVYVELAESLMEAGCSLHYPGDPGDAYLVRLLKDATPGVADVIRRDNR